MLINKSQIIRIYIQDKIEFVKINYSSWCKYANKGDKIWYFFPRLWRPKYYTEDLYRKIFYSTLYTKEEMNEEIRKHYNFNEYHLFEENNTIYRKPRIVIELPNQITQYKYFDKLEECENYLKQVKEQNSFLIEV